MITKVEVIPYREDIYCCGHPMMEIAHLDGVERQGHEYGCLLCGNSEHHDIQYPRIIHISKDTSDHA
jgi:hypothetical protein